MAKATARPKARKGKPDSVTAAAALERARLKRMIQAKRDIARLAKELERAMIRAYDATQALAIEHSRATRIRRAAEDGGRRASKDRRRGGHVSRGR
jgi:hypothetical protein